MNSISANLNIMIKAAEKASKILIRDFGELEKLKVSSKGPTDFVTNSDKKVEKIIIEELTKSRNKFSIFSEEIGEIKNSDKNNYWIIECVFRDFESSQNAAEGVGGATHVECNVEEKTKQKRLEEIINKQRTHSLLHMQERVGKIFEVLIEGVSKKSKHHYYGRTTYNSAVVFEKKNYKVGDYVMVKIISCTSATLIGKVI